MKRETERAHPIDKVPARRPRPSPHDARSPACPLSVSGHACPLAVRSPACPSSVSIRACLLLVCVPDKLETTGPMSLRQGQLRAPWMDADVRGAIPVRNGRTSSGADQLFGGAVAARGAVLPWEVHPSRGALRHSRPSHGQHPHLLFLMSETLSECGAHHPDG